MVELYFLCWNYSFFWLTYYCSMLSLFRSTCKLIQSFSSMICQINGALTFFLYYFNCFFLRLIITCRLWVIYVREDILMYRLWLNGLYGLYGPRCPLSSKRPINLISFSLLFLVNNILAGLWLNCIFFIWWNYSFFWLRYYCSIGLCFSVRV